MRDAVLVAAYHEWRPSPELRPSVRCVWSAGPPDPGAEPVLPDGCMDIIWNGVQLFVAGPDTGPVKGAHDGAVAVGIRFRPGAGPLVLGVPAVTLRDARVPLVSLWPAADRLAEMLAAQGSVAGAAEVLERAVAARLAQPLQTLRLDPVVQLAVRQWGADPTVLPVPELAREAGVTERQLRRRFLDAVGYGPKRLQRVLRFQCFLGRSARERCGLAELAAACGYADQAHLSRETAALAGRTPAQLAAVRRPDVRFVHDRDAVGR